VKAPVLEVRQEYRYTYTDAVSNVRQRLVMVPPDVHLDQRLASFDLRVSGVGEHALAWSTDEFGNRVCRVEAPRVEAAICFVAHYRVGRTSRRTASPRFERDIFLEPTALTSPDDRLRAIATELDAQASSGARRAELANAKIASAIAYQFGVTDVQTPAAMALHLGKGVCQDYAHLLLTVLRLLGIPARYVSGQLLGDGATHAWVEALVEGQVIGYDPTHARRTDRDYVTVAVGRDYADVAPTSGVFFGSATGRLTWSRSMRLLEAAA
jgi:transglutaminase-like putative cysteine protease